jgi:hypothetical protein
MPMNKTGLEAVSSAVKDLSAWSVPSQAEFFLWYLHGMESKERVTTAQILDCFDALHYPRPANIAATLTKLCKKKPPRIIRDKEGYRLSAVARQQLQAMLPMRSASASTTQLLQALLDKVSNASNRAYLEEAIICFAYGAYRGAMIMAWNLAYSNLADRIFASGLEAFNGQVGTHNFKRKVSNRSDFSDIKESDVLKIARAARLISGETLKLMEEKLGKRNSAAHPSGKIFTVVTAEEFVSDLVANVLLKDEI